MFYLTYRPQKFSEMFKPNDAAESLSKEVKNKKTVHAYLFVGPRGTGKTTTARILAKALNCDKVDTKGDPCGKCSSCKSIQSGSFIDLIEIDAASNRGIDDIRELKSKVGLAPTHGKNKVYIIDEVHMLTKEAFNALLKTLEEPPKKVTFILCTTELNKVPDTIKSRCQVFHFKRASSKEVSERLKFITKKESAKIADTTLEKIAFASLGGFRDAETLLQQVLEGEINIDSFLGLETRDGYHDFVESLAVKDITKALKFVDDAYTDGLDLYVWVGELLKYLRELLFIKSSSIALLSDIQTDVFEKMKTQCGKIDFQLLAGIIEEFIDCQGRIKDAFIPQLPIELSIVKICNGADDRGVSGDVDGDKDGGEEAREEDKNGDGEEEEPEMLPHHTKVEKDGLGGTKQSRKATKPASLVKMSEIDEKWGDFLKELKPVNHSLLAIMSGCKPVRVEEDALTIEVCYNFHKERLESHKNRQIVEEVLAGVYGCGLKIKCEINKENIKKIQRGEAAFLTDHNVVVPTVDLEVDKKALVEAFDGNLPLM